MSLVDCIFLVHKIGLIITHVWEDATCYLLNEGLFNCKGRGVELMSWLWVLPCDVRFECWEGPQRFLDSAALF